MDVEELRFKVTQCVNKADPRLLKMMMALAAAYNQETTEETPPVDTKELNQEKDKFVKGDIKITGW